MTQPAAKPQRLFIAAELPAAPLGELATLFARLQTDALPGWRWSAPASIHLTLRFLGDTPPDRIPAAAAALRRAAAASTLFSLALANAGTFGGRRPRVLWLGLAGELDALQALADALNRELHREGWPPPDRPLRPHITLARARRSASPPQTAAARDLAASLEPSETPFEIAAASLIHSTLTPAGAQYSTVESVALHSAVL